QHHHDAAHDATMPFDTAVVRGIAGDRPMSWPTQVRDYDDRAPLRYTLPGRQSTPHGDDGCFWSI
ncbi:MAG: hypothetical protein M3Q08_15705, partial [Pseudomonadota bacterium]|nr:hypothetical protein [Pseudomonadota bacterium]